MWLDPITGHVLRTDADVRGRYPQLSLPAELTDAVVSWLGLVPVLPTERPAYCDATHDCLEVPPTETADGWVQQWELIPRNIDLVREELHARRRARRNAAELGGFVYFARRIDSDRESVQRIAQAAVRALQAWLAHTPFALSWTCADDRELDLDAAGMLALQAALHEHGAACHARSRALIAAIDGADSPADLAAVAAEIDTGWPTGSP